MIIHEIRENKDGSSTLVVDMSPYETRCLIERGFVELLKEFIDRHEKTLTNDENSDKVDI